MNPTYDYKKYAILYVDDEAQALKYFVQMYGDDFTILTAPSVDDAMRVIAEHGDNLAIVISDQRMPNRTGVDLLGSLRLTRPQIIRILTTAYADLQSAIEAVNSGAIYKYVVKPWELDDLRVILMRAMEFFIVSRERDLLFREKLSVIQRMILVDRVKSLAVLAGSLSHRLRNSIGAVQQYLEQTPDAIRTELEDRLAKNPQFWNDTWRLAKNETESVIRIMNRLMVLVAEPHYTFADELDLEELLKDAAQGVAEAGGATVIDVAMDIATELPMFKVDRLLFTRMLTILIERTAAYNPPEGRLLISASDRIEVGGTPGLRILVSGEGPNWSEAKVASMFSALSTLDEQPDDLGLDLLSAFFVVYHHGGELSVLPSAPDGPGFEARIPFAPQSVTRSSLETDLLQKLLIRFDLWSQDSVI